MNWLSIALLVVIGFLTWRAYRSGFVRELVSLSAVILAIPVAGIFFDDMLPKVSPLISNVALASLVSFLAIMAGVIIGGQVISYLLKNAVRALNLGSVDAVAGAAFGFLKAVLICQAVLIGLVRFPEPDLGETIDESPVATALLDAAPLTLAILPATFDQAVTIFRAAAVTLGEQPGSPTPPPTATRTPAR